MPSASVHATVVSIPSVGGGHVGADVHQHEAARAVGVLGHARASRHACPKRAACWSPAMPLIGMPAGTPQRSDVTPIRPLDGTTSGRCSIGTCSRSHSSGVPPQRRDVEQHRAAGVGGVRRQHLATGEVPHQPRVDRAEGEVGRHRHAALAQQPLELGAAEVRVEDEPGAVRARGRGRRAAASSSQRAAVRRSCHTIARPYGRPVERSQATTVSRWLVMPIAADLGRADLLDDRRSAWPARRPRSRSASCSTQPGLREVLGELRGTPTRRAGRRRTRRGCGCPSSRRRWRSRTSRRGHRFLLRAVGPGRRAPRRRRAGAGRDGRRSAAGDDGEARGVFRSASVLRV